MKQKVNLQSTLGQIKIAKNIPSLKCSYYFDNISTNTCQRKLIACSFHKEWKVGVQIPPSQGVSSGLQRIETWFVSPHSTLCIFYKILNKQITKNQRPLKKKILNFMFLQNHLAITWHAISSQEWNVFSPRLSKKSIQKFRDIVNKFPKPYWNCHDSTKEM